MAKKTTSPAKRRPSPRKPATAPESVRVRMYRQGLGDCFLLTFPSTAGRPFHMLIDCGVILGTADAASQMRKVVQDVIATTGGTVDLAVGTHQHWDHLSGFLQASDLFSQDGKEQPGKLRIRNLWLAWTEDPGNSLANDLRARRGQRLQALGAAVQQLRGMASTAEREQALGASAGPLQAAAGLAEPIEGLLGFFGASGAGGTGGSNDTQAALDALRGYAETPPRFCHPTDPPITLPEVPGVRFYVLGPPEDRKLLLQSDPSKSHPEVYESSRSALDAESAFAAALGGAADPSLGELSLPFDRRYQLSVEQAKQERFFQRHYFAEDQVSDFKDQSWRWIDADWLTGASQLALQLDSDTNNTSLALAIELTGSGKVLLFPADAQVGNWLSWDKLAWTVRTAEGKDQPVKAAELLGRTVLYKVGHHGSHNATLREQGLERMTSDALTALIPVNHAMAVKKRWNMPFPPLLQRLKEKTKGRILQVDDETRIEDRKAPDGVPDPIWQDFRTRVTEQYLDGKPLWYEIVIG